MKEKPTPDHPQQRFDDLMKRVIKVTPKELQCRIAEDKTTRKVDKDAKEKKSS